MTLSRRSFLSAVTAATGSALAKPSALEAPYRTSVQGNAVNTASGPGTIPVPLSIPATMPMGSGAPLGGIGTGFVEIRADGCFYEWQIFNSNDWAQDAKSTTAPFPAGPQVLRFLLRVKKGDEVPQMRRLYLRSDDNDLYSLPMLHDVESIEYAAAFPVTTLHYHDSTLPVRVSAEVFSPFVPGDARASATPGFHAVYTIENTSDEAVEVSLASFLDNPLATALADRRLTNAVAHDGDTTRITLNTDAQTDFPSGIGGISWSVTGGETSFVSGSFREYTLPMLYRWRSPRVNFMLLGLVEELLATGRLPNTAAMANPIALLPDAATISTLSDAGVMTLLRKLSGDALLARVIRDGQKGKSPASPRELLKEIGNNLKPEQTRVHKPDWGASALASTVKIAAGQQVQIRFTLGWYFPHHLTTDGRELGHMYANWFADAEEVNRFLDANFERHKATAESFASTLAHTSLGDPMAFAWSSHLGTLITNTWWTRDNHYAMWEGLGCCGLSTTDVDYQGSFPLLALFPELKLTQMRQIMEHQNAVGQVPHTYAGDTNRVDRGFARVDMNPQFVMMVLRDYLWTDDRQYVDDLWPHVVRAMKYSESIDTNGDGLPDHDTGLQTYDQWAMRGTPSYVSSLWIGALRAGIELAKATNHAQEAAHWQQILTKASANFDAMLFNGDYYNLWVDGARYDELCMTDQLSGEWFTGIIGLTTTINRKNLDTALENIFRYNFHSEFGLHNATGPKGHTNLLALNNLQAGGLWSGIEFAFASMLIDHGYVKQGMQIVDAIHRRYLRAGQPWNHVECGGHYSRAMSSWATLLAATGFKPDRPSKSLTLLPKIEGDFHAPWVTPEGFGTVRRNGSTLSLHCVDGVLEISSLTVPVHTLSLRLDSLALDTTKSQLEDGVRFTLAKTIRILAGQTLSAG
ncbi:MAG: hypothetical protein KGN79_09575 [Acidobacteriota bacterium]|nr:hypothetical protein [Acidobacteriota bacterium]